MRARVLGVRVWLHKYVRIHHIRIINVERIFYALRVMLTRDLKRAIDRVSATRTIYRLQTRLASKLVTLEKIIEDTIPFRRTITGRRRYLKPIRNTIPVLAIPEVVSSSVRMFENRSNKKVGNKRTVGN